MSLQTCDHCYCMETEVNGVPHRKCCNCGNKQAGRIGVPVGPMPMPRLDVKRDTIRETWRAI